MTSRTTKSIVTFCYPFILGGHKGVFPSGSYEIIAEDEILESLSFFAYRRAQTYLTIATSGRCQLHSIDHRDLEVALANDRARSQVSKKNITPVFDPSQDRKEQRKIQ
ncbi:hypothetical protein GCM10008927_06180 [Amylibacter ulvae]|uniref:Uncharacterized protein n=1 Tax=Paramylibacter ulvae TaxID=1651968 RepID=A0ABQ3CWA7_9RHOB|nr:hypothetical protein [Amylibacter ulvae]GHA44171.1 hypothetical protein GCM10008927_06180 [Amylibacter ulvae]